jgi:hypothetical protein
VGRARHVALLPHPRRRQRGTLSQNGTPLTWDPHGYYEVALEARSLTLSP